MQTAFCLEQTAFCLVQTAVSCAFNQLLGLFFAAITAHFKIALFILEARIHPPAGGVKRGTRTHGPYPPLNNLPQSPFKLPSAGLFCSAAQVPMQCSPPMQFITTYVCFNCCRSVFCVYLVQWLGILVTRNRFQCGSL